MTNLILVISEVIICYLIIVFLYKKYQIDGIYFYGIIAAFISSIMNLKNISVMNIPIPLGLGITTSIIICGNLITQKRGLEELKNYLILVLITFIISNSFFNLATILPDSNYNLYSNTSFDSIFNDTLRISIALTISVILSVWLSSKLYYIIKKLQNKIILSNIFSQIITEFFENIAFVVIAYLFNYEAIDLFLCIILRYIIKTIIGLLGTIPIYLTNKYN